MLLSVEKVDESFIAGIFLSCKRHNAMLVVSYDLLKNTIYQEKNFFIVNCILSFLITLVQDTSIYFV